MVFTKDIPQIMDLAIIVFDKTFFIYGHGHDLIRQRILLYVLENPTIIKIDFLGLDFFSSGRRNIINHY